MSIESLLMASLTAFVLLVPALMVAVLVAGLSRRDGTAAPADSREPVEAIELPAAA
jgi:hypothetical protein